MEKVIVWDRFIRFYHWLQVGLLIGLWTTAENDQMEWHFSLAYVLLCLWITRILWGCIGSDTAKFNEFLHHPLTVISHAKTLHSGDHAHYVGHTPLGGYMVVSLIFLIGVQLISGLFSYDDFMAEGPLNYMVSDEVADFMVQTHIINFNIILVLAFIHVVVILIYLSRKQNLIVPMLWGVKTLPKGTEANLKGSWIAFVIFFILILVVFSLFGRDLIFD